MKKTVLIWSLLCVSLVFSLPVKSQEKISGMRFYSELGGPGVLFSANIDGRFKPGERLGLGYRAGLGFSFSEFDREYDESYGYRPSYTRTYYTVPVGLNYIFGKKNSSMTFEVGAGATFLTRKVVLFCYDYEKEGHVIGHMSFMFNRIPLNGGFTFRVGLTPMIGTSGDIFPMGAVGFGYAF